MLLGFLCVLITLAVAYAYLREGIFTAFVMCVNILLAGLVAFNYFEPLADMLEPHLPGFLAGFEDATCLMALFCATLGGLRYVTNQIAPTEMMFPSAIYRGGGFAFGLAAGYLTAGFLVCVLETLPWNENFMFFEPRFEPDGTSSPMRRFLPPDRMWLALMFRAGAYPFSNNEDPSPLLVGDSGGASPIDKYMTFDKYGTFTMRYARFRRYTDQKQAPHPYVGEFDVETGRQMTF